jgi:hypothetical protein
MSRRGCVEHRTWPTWLVPGSRRPLRAKGGLPGADYDCTASSSVFSTTGQCWLTLVPADLVAATGDCTVCACLSLAGSRRLSARGIVTRFLARHAADQHARHAIFACLATFGACLFLRLEHGMADSVES